MKLVIILLSLVTSTLSECYVTRTNWKGYVFNEPIGECHVGPWGYGSIYQCVSTNRIHHVQRSNTDCTGSLNTDTYVNDGDTDSDQNKWIIKCTTGCISTTSPTNQPTVEPTVYPTLPSMTPTTSEPTINTISPTDIPSVSPTIPSISPTIAPTKGIWTNQYGLSNGYQVQCNIFEVDQDETAYINQICTKFGGAIDFIRVYFNDGSTFSGGGSGGGPEECYPINNGECFSSVTVKAGDNLDSLQFTTSDQKMTPLWGGSGGSGGSINYGPDYCISKMEVCDKDLVNSIKFYFSPRITGSPTTEPTTAQPTEITISPTINPTIQPTIQEPTISPSKDPTSPPTVGIWTKWYGGTGGGCYAFSGKGEYDYINKICTRSGAFLDGINAYFTDSTISEWAGATTGTFGCYTVNKGECFSKVTVKSGGFVDSVQFGTSDHETTLLWGGNGGGQDIIQYDNYCIAKIDVCSGDLVDRIRFYFVPRVTFSPTMEPTMEPTKKPTDQPTDSTNNPTISPTVSPTISPTKLQSNDAVHIKQIYIFAILASLFYYF